MNVLRMKYLLLSALLLLAGCAELPTESSLVRIPFVTLPSAPDSIYAGALSADTVQVSWPPVIGATSYRLLWTTGDTLVDSMAQSLSCTLTTVRIPAVSGQTRILAVYASNTKGLSPRSQVTRYLHAAPPVVPAGMKVIPGGLFVMGAASDYFWDDERPLHNVILSPFYMDSTEVTQQDYKLIMGANPSVDSSDAKAPVENLTWYDALLYCNARSKRDALDTVYRYSGISNSDGYVGLLSNIIFDSSKNGYRLPTEAQWEYACRAGTVTDFYWGSEDSAKFYDHFGWGYDSTKRPFAVAMLRPNAYGLHDMSGNVNEWCYDYYDGDYYAESPSLEPLGPVSGNYRAIRGGSIDSQKYETRSCSRNLTYLERSVYIGFRCVRPIR